MTDTDRLNWLEANPQVEIVNQCFDEACNWVAYVVSGGRSDREWTEISNEESLRSCIDAARAILSQQEAK